MHYVKQFNINGVDTKQVACIELHGKPNAATEGYVGVLGIDMDSPIHDVYKCVAVNGSRYDWELLSSGLSIISATISGGGETSALFLYSNLLTPTLYVVKVGDLILDNEGYLYQVSALHTSHCDATYCGTRVVAWGMSAYESAVKNGFVGSEEDWVNSLYATPIVTNIEVSVRSGDWWDIEGGTYENPILVPGILETDRPIVDVVLGFDKSLNELYLKEWSKITRIWTSDDYITLKANQMPTHDFTIQLQVTRGVRPDASGVIHGITPLIRINDATGEWEVSYDRGMSYMSLGVKALPEEDKAEMVQEVLNALPNGDEVSY